MKNYKGILLPLCAIFFFSSKVFFGEGEKPAEYSIIRFTENKNQWDKNILYRAQLDGGVLFLEKNCFTYSFYDKEILRKNHAGLQDKKRESNGKEKQFKNSEKTAIQPIRSHAFRMTFVNAESSVETSAKQPTPDYCNYFIGNDESKWASNVKNYNEVNYTNIYKHINLQLLGLQNSIKYNFYVYPQGNTNDIQLLYEGLEAIELDNGTLKLKTSLNELVEQRPYAYQQIGNKQIEVPCEFVLEGTTVHFNFPEGYDKNYELVIDPILVFAASSGSTADNFGMTATYDAQGNLYSGGTTFSQGYPTTLGAFDTTYSGVVQYGRTDVVITKYNSTGTTLLYSTYLGGLSTEIVTSLVVNAQNELLLYGATGSSDFPTTLTAFDRSFNGGTQLTFTPNGTYFLNGTDIYVAKLNSTGSSLLASTFIGGSNNDGVNTNNIVDAIPKINIFGRLYASQFDPAVVSNAVSFFPVWNVSGTIYGLVESLHDSLQYNYGDQYRGEINVDKFGNVCIASSTRSTNFPKKNGVDTTLGGQQDAVVFKMSNDLSQLLWSTYLGGSDNDAGYALAIDNSANIYVTGGTRSADFPKTTGALRTAYNGGKTDGYITKIKYDGSAIMHSTFWGTSSYDQTYFVQLDKNNNVYVVGQTEGAMPVTAGVYNNPNSGQFITKMNDSLNTLLFSTIFGNKNGTPNISPAAFLVDYCENIYVSGWGGNIITGIPTDSMPLTIDAQLPTTDGFNFYLFVLSKDAIALQYATYFGGSQSQEHVDGGTSRFDKKGIIYQSVCAGCGGNDDFPVTPGAWPNTGADVNHSTNCNNGVFKFDFQVPLVDGSFTSSTLQGCAPLTINLNYRNPPGATYLWDFGNGNTSSTDENPTIIYSTPGTYTITLTVLDPASCNKGDTTYQYVTVNPLPSMTSSNTATICSGSTLSIPLTASLTSTYTWIAADNLNTSGESLSMKTTNTINDVLINTSGADQLVTYTVIPTSISNKCAGPAQTITVTVHPAPINTTRDSTICSNNALNIPITSDVGSTYSWIATDNTSISGESTTTQTTDTITDILINNTLIPQTVIYSIVPTSIANSCLGIPSTINAIVNPLPIVTNTTKTICNGDNVNITLASTLSSTYSWLAANNVSTTGESTTNQNTPSIMDVIANNSSIFQTVNYTITPTSSSGNCLGNSALLDVVIFPTINSQINVTSFNCTNTIIFNNTTTPPPTGFTWDFGDGTPLSQNPNPTHTYSSFGTYTVTLNTSNQNTNQYNCTSHKDTTVQLFLIPASISPDDTVCIYDEIQLYAAGGFAYNWSPAASLSDSTVSNPIATLLKSTTYTVIVSSKNTLGDTCLQLLTTSLFVIDSSKYTINATTDKDTILKGESTSLHALTNYSPTPASWAASSGIVLPNNNDVKVSPGATTTYTASIFNDKGCPKIATVTVWVVSNTCDLSDIFIPNTFTPNGDGSNDVLYVRGNSITELYFAVYNRWGQIVFETKDITKGWNGIYDDMKSDPVVFAWYLRAKCYNGEAIEKKGNVTLIR